MTGTKTLAALAVLCASCALFPRYSAAGPISGPEPFPVSDVRLTEGEFRHAQDMDIRYLLALDPDRLLAPYRKGAGLEPLSDNYPNWENTGLDGHIGGHYLSALSYMYAASGNAEIKDRLDYMIAGLKECAEASGNGYVGGVPDGNRLWDEIRRGDIRAEPFGLNGGWVPLYNIHKTYAGLRDAWTVAGSEDARELFLGFVEWMSQLTSGLSDEQLQDMLRSEHGGLAEVFADAAAISSDPRYMELARRFTHKAVLEPLLKGEDRLTGMHANTQIPKVIGIKRIADLEGDEAWDAAAAFFWSTVVNNRSVSIGGNSVREHFHPADDFSSMLESEQGPETCNTYNMLRLTKMLYLGSGDGSYMDFYERAMYNHILSTIDPVQGGFVYFTPMRSGHYKVYSQPQTSFWCCVGSGLENHARYGEMIYAHEGDSRLIVNLFIPSTLRWGDVTVEQQTRFPDSDVTAISFSGFRGTRRFALSVRVPSWTDAGNVRILVNGEAVRAEEDGGYVTVERKWKASDRVEITLPMHLYAVGLPDGSQNYSFMYGPVVLASRTGKDRLDGMFADDSRGGHIASGPKVPLQDMPVIVGDAESLLSHIVRNEGPSLEFTLSGVYPESWGEMLLEPFWRIQESRYMVYWPLVSEDDLARMIEETKLREQEAAALDARTLDAVVCGEQQPESDHSVKMDTSRSGDDDGVHWRVPAAWFSYMLDCGPDCCVRVTFRPSGTASACVSADGEVLGCFGDGDPSELSYVEFPLPEGLSGRGKVEVKIFRADGESRPPRIYEVRTVTKQ